MIELTNMHKLKHKIISAGTPQTSGKTLITAKPKMGKLSHDSLFPTIVTGAVAAYLGMTSKGSLLKDVARDVINRALYGAPQVKPSQASPQARQNNKRNKNRKFKKPHTNAPTPASTEIAGV